MEQWGAGLKYKYISDFEDTSLNYTNDAGEKVVYQVESWSTVDAYVNYRFEGDSILDKTRISFGVRNLGDKNPPFADQAFGYNSSTHSNKGRYVYLNLNRKF